MKRRAKLLRYALIAGLGLLSAAPTPGAVGSCGSDPLDGQADVVSYCKAREQLVCERKRLRGELTDDGAQVCRHDAIDVCSRRFWPNDCRPTERVARACLNALRSLDTLHTQVQDIQECKANSLCAIHPTDAGVGPGGGAGQGG